MFLLPQDLTTRLVMYCLPWRSSHRTLLLVFMLDVMMMILELEIR